MDLVSSEAFPTARKTMSEKLPVPCEPCKGTGLFCGSECEQCRGKGYRLTIHGAPATPQLIRPKRRGGHGRNLRHGSDQV
jgi:RecJ-like exonuclease